MLDKSSSGFPAKDAAERARTGILRRSCESCRALKARCILESSSSQRQRRCQRCAAHGIDCVFEEALARPKRARPTARTRVKDVEEKIDSLIALIAARSGVPETPKSLDVLPINRLSHAEATTPLPAFSGGPMFPSLNLPFSPSFSLPQPACMLHDVFSKGILSYETGDRLLVAFSGQEFAMPFVVLAPHMTLEYLRRERPCLLLSILISSADSPLQEKLVSEFRQFIAQSVIVAGQKSLDIIQGVTLFCIWQHRFSRPKFLQLYQLAQLAATMAIDLGLPRLAQASTMALQKPSLARSGREQNPQYWDEMERIRTYVGCYSVTSCISTAVRKPNQLRHAKRIEEATKLIASLNMAPSDDLLLHYIRTQVFAEEVETVFQYHDPEPVEEVDTLKTHMMAKTLERKLARLKEDTPEEARENPFIKLNFLFLRIYIHEISLRIPRGHRAKGPDCCDWCGSVLRAELIISCVRASHDFLGTYLALPDEVIKLLNVAEVGRHLYSIMLLGWVAMRQATGSLEVVLQDDLVNLSPYLEASERRMTSLVTYMPDGSPKQDSFWQLQQLFSTAIAMHQAWKAEPALIPVGDDCQFTLGLDDLLDPAKAAECIEASQPLEVQQPTPDSSTEWAGSQDISLPNFATFSPPPDWFEL